MPFLHSRHSREGGNLDPCLRRGDITVLAPFRHSLVIPAKAGI
ncbi:hypothetical protein [Candidatus Tisiphia endosymbiont of Hybos culiciformis]